MGSSKTEAKKRQRAAQKARQLSEIAKQCPVPDHISLLSYSSNEWQDLVEMDPSYKQAKGEASKLKEEGQEIRMPTFDGIDPDVVADHILSLCSDQRMYEFELKFRKKFGSYKALSFEKWANKVYDLWMEPGWKPHTPTLEWAKKEVTRELREACLEMFGSPVITPLDLEEAFQKVPKGRNSGYPFYSNKWHLVDEMHSWYMDHASRLVSGEDVLRGTPHMLYKRVQPNGEVPKMRAVECPAKSDAIAAKCFTDRLVSLFKNMHQYCGFNGGERVYRYLGKMMEMEFLIESDFSSFDQRCQGIMPHVFWVVSQMVPSKYHPYLSNTLNFYQNSSLVTPIGILSGKNGKKNGLMSGDGWTSVIGTLANAVSVKYALKRMESELGTIEYKNLAYGDDIAIAASKFSPDMFEHYMSELGMDCNRSKQNLSYGDQAFFSFLGYYHFRDLWHDGNKGIFPMSRLSPGLYYREYYASPSTLQRELVLTEEEMGKLKANPEIIEMVAIVSKLNNCSQHKDFRKLVSYVREHSPNRLDTEMIAPLSKLKEAMKTGRKSRSTRLEYTPVMSLLYELEAVEKGGDNEETFKILQDSRLLANEMRVLEDLIETSYL